MAKGKPAADRLQRVLADLGRLTRAELGEVYRSVELLLEREQQDGGHMVSAFRSHRPPLRVHQSSTSRRR